MEGFGILFASRWNNFWINDLEGVKEMGLILSVISIYGVLLLCLPVSLSS